MHRLLYALLAFGMFVLGYTPAAHAAADRVALVIGNGAYVNASALPNPPNDARAVASALRDIGFEVIAGEDLDRSAMERSLRDFLRKAQGAKVALFFYAGHGMEVAGENYLVPVDAALESASDLSFETVAMAKLLENLENDPNRANIIMLDACRDNPLARSFRARSRSNVGSGLAAYSNVGTGTLIALATAPGKVALDGEGENSPFTASLLKHIKTPGLEVRQMLTRVRKDVLDTTGQQQQPWDNSSLLGDVFLAGAPSDAPQIALLDNNSARDNSALEEAEKLRRQAAEELERARQVAKELEEARKRAEQAAADAEAERKRSAALVPRTDPTVRPTEPERPNPLDRFAAIALSKSTLSWGAGYNYNSQNSAEQRALAECAKYANDCEVVTWVRNACVALSTGQGGYGHAWNVSLKKAESESVRFCRQYGRNCKVTYSVCSLPATN
ncbi:MAG: hypothetical protein BroJett030_18810 [Alphaproteobacteria bacterium]|nr:MAG: hypothetical protein BroJett030_18810 [Alphaproteobacteria bacterium]